jgi:hypothetical protein
MSDSQRSWDDGGPDRVMKMQTTCGPTRNLVLAGRGQTDALETASPQKPTASPTIRNATTSGARQMRNLVMIASPSKGKGASAADILRLQEKIQPNR